jgi:hypothetical protein
VFTRLGETGSNGEEGRLRLRFRMHCVLSVALFFLLGFSKASLGVWSRPDIIGVCVCITGKHFRALL